ncbi:uncharacterized protein LOC109863310, partial [Pseudomyrmex gracilis]|uniref:uncharacterized protein LOC109863310 n=1 Tax=Pseudomyrmex gracilis TaxID=219809 RepID=UPI0009949E5E
TSDLLEWYDQDVMDATMTALKEFQERDSGWALTQIQNLTVNVNSHNPMRAGCQVQMPLVAALYPSATNPQQKAQYPAYASVLNFDGIEFSMTLHQIARFESNNNVSVNVFTAAEQGYRYVLLQLTSIKKDKHVNLLYVPDHHDGHVGHFGCLHYFHTSEKLAEHIVDCEQLNNSAIVLPAKGKNRLRFENYNNKERVPMVVYVDLECVLKKQDEEQNALSAHKYQRHSVFSIGYYASCEHIDIGYRSHRSEICVQWFVNELYDLAKRAKTLFVKNALMVYVPVVFHDLSEYDAHFIIKDVATAFEAEITVLPVTKETYISFTIHVNSTRDKDNQSELRVTRTEFSDLSAKDFELLTQKGVFPYKYVDNVDKLLETSLPPREAFYSSLTGETVTESEYAHATNVWQRFNIDNLGSYSDLYLKTDVLLLADVLEIFCRECLASYGLDPARYYTLSGYTWDAMLK